MAYEIVFTDGADADLEELLTYILEHDGRLRAEQVLERIDAAIGGLQTLPERGSRPRELLAIGNRDYRQIFFKPYRIIYRVERTKVYIYIIADGRRDMQTLLVRRLLR